MFWPQFEMIENAVLERTMKTLKTTSKHGMTF
jgi:hypothetical protein